MVLTEELKLARRIQFLRDIDKLVAREKELVAKDVDWLRAKRGAYYTDEARVPGDGELGQIDRIMKRAGLKARQPPWARTAPPQPADHHPDVSSPAALARGHGPTEMPAWLASTAQDGAASRGLPLRPPTRRAVSP